MELYSPHPWVACNTASQGNDIRHKFPGPNTAWSPKKIASFSQIHLPWCQVLDMYLLEWKMVKDPSSSFVNDLLSHPTQPAGQYDLKFWPTYPWVIDIIYRRIITAKLFLSNCFRWLTTAFKKPEAPPDPTKESFHRNTRDKVLANYPGPFLYIRTFEFAKILETFQVQRFSEIIPQ